MKAVISSLSDIPESLRGEYEERDGKYVLKLDGDVDGMVKADDLAEANARVKEFRDTNIRLNQKVEEFTTRFAGLDPDEHKSLKAELEEMKSKSGGQSDIERMQQKIDNIQARFDEKDQSEARAQKALASEKLEGILIREGLAAGVDQRAVADFVVRGMRSFVYKDGAAVAMDGDKQVFSRSRPAEPMPVSEWVEQLSADAPHLFKPSRGGGAQGGTDGKGGGGIVIDANDDKAFLDNIDNIASGKVTFRE